MAMPRNWPPHLQAAPRTQVTSPFIATAAIFAGLQATPVAAFITAQFHKMICAEC